MMRTTGIPRVLLLVGLLLAATGCACGRCGGQVAGALPTVEIACQRPVIAEKGVLSLDVTVRNTTTRPVTLTVCDQMTLCCIRGLHPIVEFKESEGGTGCLDFCKSAAPTGRKVRLEPGTSFAATLDLPAERLPAQRFQNKGPNLAVYCVLETDKGMAKSNVVDVEVQ